MTTPRTAVAERQSAPREVTLSQQTMSTLLMTPSLMAEMEAVSEAEGNEGLVAWLDEHGLSWHEGGPNADRAFAEAAGLPNPGALLLGGPSVDQEQRAAERRKAQRKAQRKARKTHRR